MVCFCLIGWLDAEGGLGQNPAIVAIVRSALRKLEGVDTIVRIETAKGEAALAR
jgi:hypothetical protein